MTKFFNDDYEKALLGCMLVDNSIIESVNARLSEDSFYNPKFRLIYKTAINQYNKDKVCNIFTIINTLKSLNPADIATITSSVSSSVQWNFFLQKVKELEVSRTIEKEAKKALERLEKDEVKEAITDLDSTLTDLMREESDVHGVNAKSLCISIPEKMMKLYNAYKDGQVYLGYETGYHDLDHLLDGFQNSNMYVIGARPSIGKTAFGLNIVNGLCKKGVQTAVFSLEMTAEKLFYRLVAMNSNLPMQQLNKGLCFAYETGIAKFRNAIEQIFEYPLNIYDTGVHTDVDLYNQIKMEAKDGTKVMVIDHLGLVKVARSSGQRYIDVGKITATLHSLAQELDICIILLSQCGREAEGSKPTLALLRESGNIEQDADVVMLLHRERDMQETRVPTSVIVAKNRDGQIGEVSMEFDLPYSKFREVEKKEHGEEVK